MDRLKKSSFIPGRKSIKSIQQQPDRRYYRDNNKKERSENSGHIKVNENALVRQDRELSEEYSFARGVVTGEEFETLKSNQYKFLKERNECPKNKSKTLKSCISTAVDNRISELTTLIENENKKPIKKISDSSNIKELQGEWK